MNDKVCLLRSGIVITHICTLNCKLCGGYIPYYNNPDHLQLKDIEKTIDNYFKVVDNVGDFSITGGEPLLHPELDKILIKVLKYSDRIDRVLILTNGTLLMDEKVIKILNKNREKCMVTISDYGNLSINANNLKEILDTANIPCRVIKYSGNDLFCDGWVDYGNHEKKSFTKEDTDKKGRSCAIRSREVSIIEDGELHACGRSYYRMKIGKIPKNPEEFINLLDDNLDINLSKDILNSLLKKTSITSCAYCNGLCEDSVRYIPAEQL